MTHDDKVKIIENYYKASNSIMNIALTTEIPIELFQICIEASASIVKIIDYINDHRFDYDKEVIKDTVKTNPINGPGSNSIKQYMHKFVWGLPQQTFYFSTFDELVNLHFVKEYASYAGFYKFSYMEYLGELFLMAEFSEGISWGIVGTLQNLDGLTLDEWKRPDITNTRED